MGQCKSRLNIFTEICMTKFVRSHGHEFSACKFKENAQEDSLLAVEIVKGRGGAVLRFCFLI